VHTMPMQRCTSCIYFLTVYVKAARAHGGSVVTGFGLNKRSFVAVNPACFLRFCKGIGCVPSSCSLHLFLVPSLVEHIEL